MQNNIVARDGNEGNLNCLKPSIQAKIVSRKESVFFYLNGLKIFDNEWLNFLSSQKYITAVEGGVVGRS